MRQVDHRNLIESALAACRTHFVYAAAFSGFINLLYLAPSIYMLQVYDRVVPTRGTTTLVLLTVVLLFALSCFAVLDALRMRLLQRASLRLERIAAAGLLDRVLGHRGQGTGERSQAMRDFDTLRGTLTGPAIVALFDAPWTPIYILVCFLLHPWIGALALVSALLLVLVAWRSERVTAAPLKRAGDQAAQAYQAQDFSIRASEVVRALGMRGAVVARHMGQRYEMVALQGEVARTSGDYLAATKFLRLMLGSIALGLGAWLVVEGKISAGAIFAASLIIGRALQPIEQILGALRNTLQARTAYRTLVALCNEDDGAEPRTMLPTPVGLLAVENLTVLSPARDVRILTDISFQAVPGELIALVGPSGAGKSTLLRALSGAISPDGGAVRIDGASYEDWDPDQLARFVGYVPQEASLFPGSIHNNIARFRNFAEVGSADLDRRVVEAAQASGAHEMILRLPGGYMTLIGPGGIGLSAGQMQRIALARALFDKPVVVLLDEPNAHLDGEGDALLLKTLAELKARGATVIVSAHRTGILSVSDKILVLREGRVQTFGRRDEVLGRAALEPPIAPEPITAGPTNAGGDVSTAGSDTLPLVQKEVA